MTKTNHKSSPLNTSCSGELKTEITALGREEEKNKTKQQFENRFLEKEENKKITEA